MSRGRLNQVVASLFVYIEYIRTFTLYILVHATFLLQTAALIAQMSESKLFELELNKQGTRTLAV